MEESETSAYHLVHANVAHALAALDAPLMADFISQVDEINALASSAPGFVAQPTLPDEGTLYRAPLLLNVSIWKSIASLEAFTYQRRHAAALERRGEWFKQSEKPSYVLYWTREGDTPTEREVKERLRYLRAHGPTSYAFSFDRTFTSLEASYVAPDNV